MQEQFGSNPKDILAVIGPSIGPCHFSFGSEAKDHFPPEFCKSQEGGYLVDLWAMNKSLLLAQGVLDEHIEVAEVCTVCRAEAFYSYRTHKEHTGRQAAIIMIK